MDYIRGRSSNWLERELVTLEVEGSNPFCPAKDTYGIVYSFDIEKQTVSCLCRCANDGELGRTVNPLPSGLVGSTPTTGTISG